MSTLLVTADTNTIASGIVQERARPDAAAAAFIRAWRAGQFLLVQSDPLRDEVRRTLAKPYFAQRLRPEDYADLEQLFARRARHTPITVDVQGAATHPEDDLVLATALSGGAQFVVTGDYKLIRLKQYRGLILVTVHEFSAMLPGLLSDESGEQMVEG